MHIEWSRRKRITNIIRFNPSSSTEWGEQAMVCFLSSLLLCLFLVFADSMAKYQTLWNGTIVYSFALVSVAFPDPTNFYCAILVYKMYYTLCICIRDRLLRFFVVVFGFMVVFPFLRVPFHIDVYLPHHLSLLVYFLSLQLVHFTFILFLFTVHLAICFDYNVIHTDEALYCP